MATYAISTETADRLLLEDGNGVLIVETASPLFRGFRKEDNSGNLLLEDGSGIYLGDPDLFYAYQLEQTVDRYLLEDGSGVLISEEAQSPAPINAGTASLTLTGQTGTVSTPVAVAASPRAITLAPQQATVAVTVKAGGFGPSIEYRTIRARPRPVVIESEPAQLRLRPSVAVIYTTRTLTEFSGEAHTTRYLTAEELFALWQQQIITTQEAAVMLPSTRKNQWSGSISRLVTANLMDAD